MKKFFTTIILLLISKILIAQTFYENDLLKFKMKAPANWYYVGSEESRKNLKKIKFTDEQLKEIAKSSNGLISQISYYKYNADSVIGFIPTIKITVRMNPAEDFDEFKAIMTNSAEALKSILNDFEFIDKISVIKVSNRNSIYYSCTYTITPVASSEFTVRTKSYNIPRGQYFISLTLMDNNSTEDCSDIFNEIMNTISIAD